MPNARGWIGQTNIFQTYPPRDFDLQIMQFTTDPLLNPAALDPAEWANFFEDEWTNPSFESSDLFSRPTNDANKDINAIDAPSPSTALDDMTSARAALAAISNLEPSAAAVPKLGKETPAASEVSRDELFCVLQRMWTA